MLLIYFLLLLYKITNATTTNKCFQCASEHMIIYWERYMPIQNGMSGQADSKCKINSAKHEVVSCNGPCLLLNVTGIDKKGKNVSYGILRDCQTTYWKNKIEVGDDKLCKIQNKRVNGIDMKAEYCFCNGHYCNGMDESLIENPVAFKRKSHHRHPYTRSSSYKNCKIKFINVTILMVLIFVKTFFNKII
uniref:Protein quiver n=1 Tax=Strongyloides stercoralis TaxID=6248 RepID=A0AAF5D7M9_STRER